METSLPQSEPELKIILQRLDTIILDKAREWARKTYQATLEQVDELMAEHRGDELKIEHRREVWYQTCLGPVRVKRRQYRDGDGRRRCLLDEVMGMGRGGHVTHDVQELALGLAATMPYRRSAEVLRKTTAIDLTHQTVWRMVGKAGDPYLEKAERELKWFLETGELPESEGKKVARLLVEADGVMLSLQREKERKAEVKLGIAYEGWEKVGKDRYKTVNKTIFSAVTDSDSFWAGMSLKLQRKYDLSRVGNTIVGGDGAAWVKEGTSYIGGQFQLDRYHLNRELCEALGRDRATKARVWEACERGDGESGLAILQKAAQNSRGEQAARLARACHYLQDNLSGLGDYRLSLGEERRTLRRTGAMEGNVDKLVARRMKNQGMSWSVRGISRLLCVRFLVLDGQLKGWIERRDGHESSLNIPQKKIRRVVTRLSTEEPDAWLTAELPALRGPHAFRPWVRALKALTESPRV